MDDWKHVPRAPTRLLRTCMAMSDLRYVFLVYVKCIFLHHLVALAKPPDHSHEKYGIILSPTISDFYNFYVVAASKFNPKYSVFYIILIVKGTIENRVWNLKEKFFVAQSQGRDITSTDPR